MFLLDLQRISQEARKVVWYFQLFKNFPQFLVLYRVKGFSIVNETEVDVFLEFSCFFYDAADVGNLISASSAFSKSSLNIWKFSVHILLKPAAAAKSLQSYPTLCDPIDSSPPGSPGKYWSRLPFPSLKEFYTVCCATQSKALA